MLSRRAFLGAAASIGFAMLGGCGNGEGQPGSAASGDAASTPSMSPGSTSPPLTAPAEFVVRGPAAPARVALTFHTDGDLGIADQLLDLVADRRVPITVFVVGQWLDANPAWASRLVDGGHELANHTYTHPAFSQLDPATMRDEINRTRDVLVRLTGKPGRYFRPSGTADGTTHPDDAVLAAAGDAGYRMVLGFDVDPFDYQSPGPSVIVQRTLAAVQPGSVVSLHFGYPGTVAALPAILDGLDARGLTPVTASTLLAGS